MHIKKSQLIKYQRQRGFHIPELGKFLKGSYWILRRSTRSPVYSLRSGGASPAANNGILDRLISKQGHGLQRRQGTVILRKV